MKTARDLLLGKSKCCRAPIHCSHDDEGPVVTECIKCCKKCDVYREDEMPAYEEFFKQMLDAAQAYAVEKVWFAFGLLLAGWKGDRMKFAKVLDEAMDDMYPGWRSKEGRKPFAEMLDVSE